MTDDDSTPKPETPLSALIKEDLDPISIDELENRIKTLEEEIERIRAKIGGKKTGLSAAEALFKS